MNHALVALSAALLVAGCTHATEFAGPSGERMVSVSCDGLANDVGNCLRRVSDECPNGYQLVGGGSSSTPIATGGNSFGGGVRDYSGGGGFTGGNYISRNVIAVCK